MARLLTVAALAAGLGASSTALAQASSNPPPSVDSASAPTVKERPQQSVREIERGFYFGMSAGPSFVVNPPATSGVSPFSPGQMVEAELGFDIGPYFAISLFARAAQQREDITYFGTGTDHSVSGDFSMLTPGVSVRIKPIGLKDAQDVQRTWIYLRAGVGYTIFNPAKLLPTPDILVFAGPGVEYYTRLRHFSVGVEAVGSLLASSKAFGFAITPTLRYAF